MAILLLCLFALQAGAQTVELPFQAAPLDLSSPGPEPEAEPEPESGLAAAPELSGALLPFAERLGVLLSQRDSSIDSFQALFKSAKNGLSKRQLARFVELLAVRVFDAGRRELLPAPDHVRTAIRYVANNPIKGGLPAQLWPFVAPHDNWPFHKRRK